MNINIKAFHLIANKVIPLDTNASSLDLFTASVHDGFYTTFSTLDGGKRVLGLSSHLQRLYVPAKEKKLTPSTDEKFLREQLTNLAKDNLPNESRVRLILTKDTGDVFIAIQPFEPIPESVYQNGVHVITSSVSRSDPRIKDSSFISKSSQQRTLLNKDTFEVLLTKNGKILEGMTSNFYAVKGKTLITAQRGILLGVTRKVLLKLARGQGMSIEYRAPFVNEKFDEAFLTSSSRGVVPIVSIDGKPVGQGRVGAWTKKLISAYRSYVMVNSELILDK